MLFAVESSDVEIINFESKEVNKMESPCHQGLIKEYCPGSGYAVEVKSAENKKFGAFWAPPKALAFGGDVLRFVGVG